MSHLPKLALSAARAKYGTGWDRIGAEAQRNAIAYEALLILAGQAMDKYRPAVDLAQEFLSIMPEAR